MRYLLPLLFIFGCEGFGVFEHDHNEGSCVRLTTSPNEYFCYENYLESDCVWEDFDHSNSGYSWTDLTCEEFCDDVDSGSGYSCQTLEDSPPYYVD